MRYDELMNLYKNNEFREIDKQTNYQKFYLLRSISKANTLKKFCKQTNSVIDLNKILEDNKIKEDDIIKFIK